MSGAGDVNGDGCGDVVISGYERYSYIVMGGKNLPSQLQLKELNGKNGLIVYNDNVYQSNGYSDFDAADFNNDGLSDPVICSTSSNSDSGQCYMIYGSKAPFPRQLNVTQLNGDNGFTISGAYNYEQLGNDVSNIGNLEGQGDCFIIGADKNSEGDYGSVHAYVICDF